ncbi:prolipoprotein diacylglyceryl transferase [Maribacter algarum]|uniref:Phosphatidylglycerol--prolipoprotein diacylglyceryl transferase n=1 Tax=Maribacter algarum (ex Zhang et al. 2020) TaxID=2578118 RepID=A0A5S3PSM9_9FLAO|nr:prolipoprotein diacylglyceryl transferase [Maribacter algarum]TMM57953.1 prolipoprotein diacylglyceryl transferase [Maribacter algarum]
MYFLGITWNPNETLFSLGPLQIKYYNLLWIATFAIGWFLMKRIFTNEKKTVDQLDSLFIYMVLATMLGARLGHVFFYDWPYYSDHLLEILLPIRESAEGSILGFIDGYEFTGFTGLASHGATIGIILAVFLYIRKNPEFKPLWIMDRLAIVAAIGAFCVRLGNFFNSEIIGKKVEESFIFATRFVRDSIGQGQAMSITKEKTVNAAYDALVSKPEFSEYIKDIPYRHPAQLYEGVGYLMLFFLLYYLYWKTDKKDKPGFLFGTFTVVLWGIRFLAEFVKERQNELDESFTLAIGQMLSIPFILIGLYFMFRPTASKQ